ncbi:MAG: fasciclin domain-containing protein [Pseudomonadota bacterium]
MKVFRRIAIATAIALPFVAAQLTESRAASIAEVAQSAGQFDTLLAAAQAAGLADALTTGGPFTVFAPTDEAFAALPDGTVENLLRPENRDQLAAILSYHVLPRRLASNMLPGRTIHVRTIKQGGDRLLAVTKSGGGVTVDEATVVSADIEADNGIIHVIDKVMLPSS